MVAQVGIEELQVPDFLPEEGALALGSLVRLTHTFTVKEPQAGVPKPRPDSREKQKPDEREVKRVLQGFVVGARYDTAITVGTCANGEKPSITRTPTVAYHLAEVVLESYDGIPKYEQYGDVIFHRSDEKYHAEVLPPVLN